MPFWNNQQTPMQRNDERVYTYKVFGLHLRIQM